MLPFASCYICSKVFIPNKSTAAKKCTESGKSKYSRVVYNCVDCTERRKSPNTIYSSGNGNIQRMSTTSTSYTKLESHMSCSATAAERLWCNNTSPERELSEVLSNDEHLKIDVQQLKKEIKGLEFVKQENKKLKSEIEKMGKHEKTSASRDGMESIRKTRERELKDEIGKVREENRELKSEMESIREKKEKELREEIEQIRKESEKLSIKLGKLANENKDLKGEIGKVRKENWELKYEMESTREIKEKEFREEIEQIRRNESEKWTVELEKLANENKELKGELEQIRKEMNCVQSVFVNFEQTKESCRPEGDDLLEQITNSEENARLKAKFDEFEECNEIIKSIQLDQERVEQEISSMEERNGEVSESLGMKIEELQNQIDNFVTETKSDLNEKKNQLIQQMKRSIQQLQGNNKALIDRCRDLQQQNIKRSTILQHKLELTTHNFNDTVQTKASLLSYYDTEGDSTLLPNKNWKDLEQSEKFGSSTSLSTTASSFEIVPDDDKK